jgi:hypothetical protein
MGFTQPQRVSQRESDELEFGGPAPVEGIEVQRRSASSMLSIALTR